MRNKKLGLLLCAITTCCLVQSFTAIGAKNERYFWGSSGAPAGIRSVPWEVGATGSPAGVWRLGDPEKTGATTTAEGTVFHIVNTAQFGLTTGFSGTGASTYYEIQLDNCALDFDNWFQLPQEITKLPLYITGNGVVIFPERIKGPIDSKSTDHLYFDDARPGDGNPSIQDDEQLDDDYYGNDSAPDSDQEVPFQAKQTKKTGKKSKVRNHRRVVRRYKSATGILQEIRFLNNCYSDSNIKIHLNTSQLNINCIRNTYVHLCNIINDTQTDPSGGSYPSTISKIEDGHLSLGNDTAGTAIFNPLSTLRIIDGTIVINSDTFSSNADVTMSHKPKSLAPGYSYNYQPRLRFYNGGTLIVNDTGAAVLANKFTLGTLAPTMAGADTIEQLQINIGNANTIDPLTINPNTFVGKPKRPYPLPAPHPEFEPMPGASQAKGGKYWKSIQNRPLLNICSLGANSVVQFMNVNDTDGNQPASSVITNNLMPFDIYLSNGIFTMRSLSTESNGYKDYYQYLDAPGGSQFFLNGGTLKFEYTNGAVNSDGSSTFYSPYNTFVGNNGGIIDYSSIGGVNCGKLIIPYLASAGDNSKGIVIAQGPAGNDSQTTASLIFENVGPFGGRILSLGSAYDTVLIPQQLALSKMLEPSEVGESVFKNTFAYVAGAGFFITPNTAFAENPVLTDATAKIGIS